MSGCVIPLLKTPQRACLRVTAEVLTMETRFILLEPHSSLHFSHSAPLKHLQWLFLLHGTLFSKISAQLTHSPSPSLIKCPFQERERSALASCLQLQLWQLLLLYIFFLHGINHIPTSFIVCLFVGYCLSPNSKLFCSLMYSQCLAECLANDKLSVNFAEY